MQGTRALRSTSSTWSRRSSSAAGDNGSSPVRVWISGVSERYDRTAPYAVMTSCRGVVATDAAGLHLRLEEAHCGVEHRLQRRAELLDEHRAAVERFAPRQAHEHRLGLEVAERGAEHVLDLRPPLLPVDRGAHQRGPLVEALEHHGPVQRVLRREVVQQARPPDPDLVGDLVQARAGVAVLGKAIERDGQDPGLRVPLGHFGRRSDHRAGRLRARESGDCHRIRVIPPNLPPPASIYRPVGRVQSREVPPLHPLVALVVGFAVMQISVLATTVYLHRGIAHRAVTIKPAAAIPLRFIIWITTGMRPRQWAAVHRRHHAKVDTVDDPHSPLDPRLLARATRQRLHVPPRGPRP